MAFPEADEIHVWHVDLAALAAHGQELRGLLAPPELAASERLRFEPDRLRFVTRRAVLRSVLGSYLGIAPGLLRFRTNKRGKPDLDGAPARSGIRFNASHSGGLAVYAVSMHKCIGVDVEAVRPIDNPLHIARCFFSPLEHKALSDIPAQSRSLAFLHCWTRKEAFVKALGCGLHHPLEDFDVSLTPGEPAALLRLGSDFSAGLRWSMISFAPGSSHVAAVVVPGASCRLSLHPWNESAP